MGEDIQSTMNTPTPSGKWTPSSLMKLLEKAWSDYLKAMLDTDVYTKEEKNRRIDMALVYTKMVHDRILEREIKFKKN